METAPAIATVLLRIIDYMLFVIVAVNAAYLLVFTVASFFRPKARVSGRPAVKRVAILIPAYKEDNVIAECALSCLEQDYPGELFETVVISDSMRRETVSALKEMGATVIEVSFENSTKSKALNAAMARLGDGFDLALVLDGDNVIERGFLAKIKDLFDSGAPVMIAQAHRCAKNTNTPMALLDAVSEEINNTIFRQGHSNMGLSAALIGSGMCFDYALFKRTMAGIDAVGGFDRALELTLLWQGLHIEYLPGAMVLDEKVQRPRDFSRQRRRWMSAQAHYMRRFIGYLPAAVRSGNIDFCDKLFQQMSLPRLMLIGLSVLMAVVTAFVGSLGSWKWWIVLALLAATLLGATPRRFFTAKLLRALLQLPLAFLLMSWNLVRMRGANKKFIHTSHGVDPGEDHKS